MEDLTTTDDPSLAPGHARVPNGVVRPSTGYIGSHTFSKGEENIMYDFCSKPLHIFIKNKIISILIVQI